MFESINIHPVTFISALSTALELTSTGIASHHRRTAIIARYIGRAMHLSTRDDQTLVYSALLHDIGAAADWYEKHYIVHATDNDKIFHHAENGYTILKNSPQLGHLALPIRYHHDRFCGGNPSGLIGKDIPLMSRIIHLSDRIEVLIDNSKHIFLQRERIYDQIIRTAELFDPDLVAVFKEVGAREVFWLDVVTLNNENRFFSDLKFWDKYAFELEDLIHVANVFSSVVDSTSHFTAAHSQNVARVAQKLALIRGFSADEASQFYLTGLVHDIGKLAVPNDILNKPGPLSETEREIIKQHPYYSQRILEKVEGFEQIAHWIGTHHETLDGSGYPFQLKAHEIELGSRILAVADIFSALVEDRPYRESMLPLKAIEIMKDLAIKNKIDSKLVDDVDKNADDLSILILKTRS
ncbi:MAG: HD domain-containing protein [Eubacteriales bacterium]|nr:HD domain-containing protein [Eubacteriales bacterium]